MFSFFNDFFVQKQVPICDNTENFFGFKLTREDLRKIVKYKRRIVNLNYDYRKFMGYADNFKLSRYNVLYCDLHIFKKYWLEVKIKKLVPGYSILKNKQTKEVLLLEIGMIPKNIYNYKHLFN